MTIGEDIANRSAEIFKTDWKTRQGRVVPAPENVALGNDAVEFEAITVLYADLDSSTNLVDAFKWQFASEIYKTFLYAAARLIVNEGGTITSYDGDRVMGVFVGEGSTVSATRCALKINFAVKNLVQPKIKGNWATDFQISHVVGIDRSFARAVRTGARDNNELVWVAPAANHAAKLTSLSAAFATRITKRAFLALDRSTWYAADRTTIMWTETADYQVAGEPTYGSTFWWPVP